MSSRNLLFAIFIIAAVSITWSEAKPTQIKIDEGLVYGGYGEVIEFVEYSITVSTDCTPLNVIEDNCANCDDTCDSYFNGMICEVCIWGCRCAPGYVRNATSNDYAKLTAACIKPEECDSKYDRRPENISVTLPPVSPNPVEQNQTTLVNEADVTTEYTIYLSNNTEDYSTTLPDNITGDNSTNSPDNNENYSTTLSENTVDYSTHTPDNNEYYSTTSSDNINGDYSTNLPENNENYSTTLSENTVDYSTHVPDNHEYYSTTAVTEETTETAL